MKLFFPIIIASAIAAGFFFAFSSASLASNHEPWLILHFPSSPEWDGYKFLRGGQYSIDWFGMNLTSVDIYLLKSGQLYRILAEDVPLSQGGGPNQWGSISGGWGWTVDPNLPLGDDYAIEVAEHVGPGQFPRARVKSGLVSIARWVKSHEEITDLLKSGGKISAVDAISDIKVQGEKRFYEVRGKKRARILFIIPVQMTVELTVDGVSGDVVAAKKPWWSFIAR